MFLATKIPPQLPGPTFRELYGNVPEYIAGRPTPQFAQYIKAQTRAMDAGRVQMFDSATGRGVSSASNAEPYEDYFDEVQRLREKMLNPMLALSDTAQARH
jgi:hypothetical protein